MSEDANAFALSLLSREDGPGASQHRLEPVTGGMSGASVYRVAQPGRPPRYLKVAAGTAAAGLRDEITRTAWLAERGVPVPRILRAEDQGNRLAVLTEAMAGVPADTSPLATPRLIPALAMGLAALHALPPEGCPFDESLAIRLARANRAISAGEIDPGEFAAHNLGIAPEVLLQRLIADEPGEDIVVVHGDATLSNMMIDKNGNLGFVDCGNAGRGDRYVDLAVLAADIEDHRGAEAAAQFVKAYGVHAWDPAKARYYTDLYELF